MPWQRPTYHQYPRGLANLRDATYQIPKKIGADEHLHISQLILLIVRYGSFMASMTVLIFSRNPGELRNISIKWNGAPPACFGDVGYETF